ncbi:hypothetical protein NHJ13734_009138 [Beauveria thailandica]
MFYSSLFLLFPGFALGRLESQLRIDSHGYQTANLNTTLVKTDICSRIESEISGKVYYSSDETGRFSAGFAHALSSSSEIPLCVVEVAGADDVSTSLKILGASRTPFAIQSGGRATNPGFSSTPGVHITLARLKEVRLSPDKSNVTVGLGNSWVDVYKALQGTNVGVVGGRVAGPGVGGLTLGGGYSWLTNQFGLACDTVLEYHLILPNGTAVVVDSSVPDLFFALKGGLNRFGVVTSIVFRAFPQPGTIYGGLQLFPASSAPALVDAIQRFYSDNTDPKSSAILSLYGGASDQHVLLLFHDGPGRPPSFDHFSNITAAFSNVRNQSYASFTGSVPFISSDKRGAFQSLSTSAFTPRFLAAVANETLHYGQLAKTRAANVTYHIEPFMDYGKHATDAAFPHHHSPLPLNVFFSWDSELDDAFWKAAMQQSVNHLVQVAAAEEIYNSGLVTYPNYAMDNYAGEQIYGLKNTARLREIQFKYDPNGIMFLAGGFSF